MSAHLIWQVNSEEKRLRQGQGCVQLLRSSEKEEWMRAFVGEKAHIELPDGTLLSPKSRAFHLHLGFVSSHCGLIANISLRENLLLGLLHHRPDVEEEWNRAEELARQWHLEGLLDQRVGGASPWVHAIASLLRCRLQQASFLLVDDAMHELTPSERRRLRKAFDEMVAEVQAGWLWVATEEVPEMPACR